MQTLEQERAQFAWESVQGKNRDYRNLVKSAPALVMSNGLMQMLAFLKGKGKEHHLALLRHVTGWLQKKNIISKTDFKDVMEELYSKDSFGYQQATEETMSILRWLRHLADTVDSTQERGGGNG